MLQRVVEEIGDLNRDAMEKAQQRLDSLIKPPGSLGVLEEVAVRLAGITGNPRPEIKNKAVIVMAGDHGIYEEGVSAAPQEVTYQMLPAFVNGVNGIGVLARQAGARVVVVDVGVAVPVNYPGVLQKKVKAGTDNMTRGPAMTRDEAIMALEVGIDIACQEIERGAELLATGDMGIANTTPSTAILAVLGNLPVKDITGRGTLVNDEILNNKKKAIARAIEINKPDPEDPVDVLAKVGGLEIAGLAGMILGAASKRVPVLVDGYISSAAALIASRIAPKSKEFMLPSHLSGEKGHRLMLEVLGLKPMLHLNMRLGEGTGSALAMHIVEGALRILHEMASFDEANVSDVDKSKVLKK
ncbi:nicotinate-nucleotide--dimethylbenzimidazole phosphoribosyltransferase [Desulfolucanica intricata]|uniref:nicotinate-nucleotide--dimethylbenzimidazole phosphoribosyltransferase n=1 Tax=Desulfolucanica intricata TaxID=1285191 RepID=UPI000830A31F|nr:nicotinate-nucleotide--dimethylbenzimidazole phosphoribosyltransferase [Desulfolucanica intricata]